MAVPPRTVKDRRSLDALADALIAINSCRTVADIASELTDQARVILDASSATLSLSRQRGGVETTTRLADLSVDLPAQDGTRLGRLAVSGKRTGTFDADDETVLFQLARIASTAIERANLQAELERRLGQLQGLAEAAVAVNSPLTTEEVLERLTHAAAEIVGVHVAVTDYTGAHEFMHPYTAVYLSPEYAQRENLDVEPPRSITSEVTTENVSVRRGSVLATSLVSREGTNLGLVYLVDKLEGTTFSAEDQAILEQLATLASVTVEKARLYATQARQEAARFRDDLLAGMSHDMQTPLSVIVGIADSLSEDPQLPVDERIPIYATIARQARRLRSLVNQFLDFSRIEADRPLSLDLQAVDVVEVIDHVVPLFTHQREIIVGADGELPEAHGDRERLEQVLVNLISNAIKYSESPIRVVARPDGGRVIIDVVDEGPGMSEAELDQVFEKFQRGSAAPGTRGTGLGLYISRALTEAQGGTLTASSRSGLGSRFRVSLDVAS